MLFNSGFWLLASGFWLLASGFWLPASGFLQLISHPPKCRTKVSLGFLHAADIVHRDIKPENIYLHSSPKGEVAKLLDFGISKMLGSLDEQTLDNTTRTGNIVGTPAYMAPERLANKPYDGRADVYSLGVISHRMLCGHAPFHCEREDFYAMAIMHLTAEASPLRQTDPAIPESLDNLILQTLAKDPGQRPTARELAASLRAVEASLP